jgi:hypothetical protein
LRLVEFIDGPESGEALCREAARASHLMPRRRENQNDPASPVIVAKCC